MLGIHILAHGGHMKKVDQQVLKQEELEAISVEEGIKKYRDALLTTPLSEIGAGLRLMKDCMEPMIRALKVYFKPGKGNPKYHKTKEVLKLFSPEVLAYITSKSIINSLAHPDLALQTISVQLAGMLKENHLYMKFKEEHPGYLYRVQENLKTSTLTHKRKVITRARNLLGVSEGEWNEVDKFYLGKTLIELFIKSTGVVRVETVIYKHKDTCRLVPEQATLDYLARAHGECELLDPRYYPMIIPPKNWTVPFDGAFLATEATMKQTMVKTRDSQELFRLADHQMPEVYDAINNLQQTAWRINRKIFDVFEDMVDSGMEIAGLPSQHEEPLPTQQWDDREPGADELKAWKRKASEVYDRRVRVRSKRVGVGVKRRIANRLKDEPRIYFCYTMDWRGRVYPIQTFVDPQGDDTGRALIEFAEGKPLGERGVYWLAVHGANCYGVDKVSFEDRVQWVRDNQLAILDSAYDSVDGERFWCDAENPFQFLAFCFEWAGYIEEGKTYESHIPVGMDGSCNGLQNFSGLLLDPIGGAATNLVPGQSPNDIYQEVADVLNAKVEQDVAVGDENAKLWRGKITRKVTKRGVMTTPYGATTYGLRNQLRVELAKIDPNYLDVEDDAPAIKYLAGRLYEAISEVVVSARTVMDWLQVVASACSKADKPIRWTTPVGFTPIQNYKLSKLVFVDTIWGGIRLRLGLRTDKDRLDRKKQANGISPNYIHSLDAAHMMKTVNKCRDEGITAFSMVHDSYGTHAASIDKMHEILRDTFIEIYSEDQLAKFYSEVAAQLTPELIAEIPELPVRGSLDLQEVRKSCYFFA
jgi:DNA-directed RNA polymerase